jgi:hypothetical protein
VRAAVHGAQKLAELVGDTPIVVHVADLRVRESVRGAVVAGTPIERVESWWPTKAPSGVVLTAEAAAALGGLHGQGNEVTEDGALLHVETADDVISTSGPSTTVPLAGRQALAEEVLIESRRTAVEGIPRLGVLAGGDGLGKSRLTRELAATSRGCARRWCARPPTSPMRSRGSSRA